MVSLVQATLAATPLSVEVELYRQYQSFTTPFALDK
jgi:hypothetical protein